MKEEETKTAIENDRYKENTSIRKGIVIAFLIIKSLWLASVIFILIQNKLSEGIFIMLLGTTTINIVGLSYIIFNNVFPERVMDKGKELKKEE